MKDNTAMNEQRFCCGGILLQKGQRCPICGGKDEEDETMKESADQGKDHEPPPFRSWGNMGFGNRLVTYSHKKSHFL